MKKKTRDEENKEEKNMKKRTRTILDARIAWEASSRRHERQEPKLMMQSYRAEARENSTSTEEKTKAYATQMKNKKCKSGRW